MDQNNTVQTVIASANLVPAPKRGRPPGAFNKETIRLATEAGMSPAEWIKFKSQPDPSQPKKQRGRPKGSKNVPKEGAVQVATAQVATPSFGTLPLGNVTQDGTIEGETNASLFT